MVTKVGDAVKYRGYDCVVTRIERFESTTFAREGTEEMEAADKKVENKVYSEYMLEEFEEGDIISIEGEYCELTSPGHHMFFIYTKFRVKRVEERKEKDGTFVVRGDNDKLGRSDSARPTVVYDRRVGKEAQDVVERRQPVRLSTDDQKAAALAFLDRIKIRR